MFFGEAAEDQHWQVRGAGPDGRQRVDTALVGHGQVHHQHVDIARPHQFQGLSAGGGFACDLQVHLVREKLTKSGANDGVVVNDGNSNHGRRSISWK